MDQIENTPPAAPLRFPFNREQIDALQRLLAATSSHLGQTHDRDLRALCRFLEALLSTVFDSHVMIQALLWLLMQKSVIAHPDEWVYARQHASAERAVDLAMDMEYPSDGAHIAELHQLFADLRARWLASPPG